MEIKHLLLIDIDGLRGDIFRQALETGKIPNLARLLGGPTAGRGLLIPALSTAPSVTFCAQASLFTGTHPKDHGVPGNQFFDRFGNHNDGIPRHYAFDVGDTLAVDDAVQVFTSGLAANCLEAPTIYEIAAVWGWQSLVAGHMYAKGADTWLKPSVVDLARFTKGGDLFGMSSQEYDRNILEKTIAHITTHGLPNILTYYMMGLDHESHAHSPDVQLAYLSTGIDPLIGELWAAIESVLPAEDHAKLLCAIFSDHGQISVVPDDRHSLRLAFPFEREMGHLFDALGLDVHDYPGEDPDCDAVVASNGGMAHVYLRNPKESWQEKPDFESDVLPVAQAFWHAHQSGKYAVELQGALNSVLLRDVKTHGWTAPYQALTPEGQIVPLEAWFAAQPAELNIDPVARLDNLTGPYTGDLLLISNYAEGFYFSGLLEGVHGGLHPADSRATMAFGLPYADEETWQQANSQIQTAIATRCAVEGGRQPSVADLLTGLMSVISMPDK